jgi:NADPH-dependent curcumin reductase CurA
MRATETGEPEIAGSEVLVKVHAAGIDRGTWHAMTGLPYLGRLYFGLRKPKRPVPGFDVAGTVAAIGAEVTRSAVGDEVFGIGKGSFTEHVSARDDKLVPKPANITFEQAAVIAISGLTALQSLRDAGRVEAGHHVLIIGASSGVGTLPYRSPRTSGQRSPACAARPNRSRDLDRRRPCHRLLPRRLRRRPAALRPHPRHRRKLIADMAATRAHPARDARHRRRGR